ncbi:MAG: 16S rRNA (adenine(1518)-N(6)/adenine(1519)-N(6))-dimethyltransferase RsmA [Oscillospiraceae bacterium]|jgi:16S rRNA (adenine1518-N6/adenine1519-N6)-dimethyltransferase|nr:16S rRNA (adenine(1518)-N(6)/adenine(1519)-N(6))-dimethyltransferase RsmA [Oscillospiraceae bacterium]
MVLTNISVVKELLSRHGFSFTKSLGQNFLVNPRVSPRMAADALSGLEPPRNVIEIGAGVGVLTRELAVRADNVAVVEIDETLKPVLSETLADFDNVGIIWGDALNMDMRALIAERFGAGRASVCANLPYYAATRVITRLLEERLPINSITVMVQEEVARRITAPPGSGLYGILSVGVNFYGSPKALFRVPRGSFLPSPGVDSAVIKIDVFKERRPEIPDERLFFRLVRAAFSERRKQLANPVSKEFGLDKQTVKQALRDCGLNTLSRAEELGTEDFIRLCGFLPAAPENPLSPGEGTVKGDLSEPGGQRQ